MDAKPCPQIWAPAAIEPRALQDRRQRKPAAPARLALVHKHGPQCFEKTAAAEKESAACQRFLIDDARLGWNPGLISSQYRFLITPRLLSVPIATMADRTTLSGTVFAVLG